MFNKCLLQDMLLSRSLRSYKIRAQNYYSMQTFSK
jgi:hypothetical protein